MGAAQQYAEVTKLEAQIKDRIAQVASLEETLRDLRFSLDTQRKVRKSVNRDDIIGGKLYVP